MTGASPWSVKGIASEERELAKQAARRAGVPIGQWLSRQIREAAQQERAGRRVDTHHGRMAEAVAVEHGAPSPTAAAWRSALAAPAPDLPHPPPMPYGGAHMQAPQPAPQVPSVPQPAAYPARPAAPAIDPARVRDLERRVGDLQQLEGRLAGLEKLEHRLGTVVAGLMELRTRIDDVEKRVDGRFSALSRDLEAVGTEIEELRARPVQGESMSSVAASTAPIERAVMRLAERLQRVEEITLPDERAGRGFLGRLFRR